MPYVLISVEGNPSFGGYLSIDKGPSHAVSDGSYFEISNGTHVFDIGSKSKATNKALEVGSLVNVRMGGEMLGSIAAVNAIGDEWSFQLQAFDDEVIVIEVLSKGNNIIATPSYRVDEFTDEALAEVKEHFKKVEIEANKPKRSILKILIGGYFLIVGLAGGMSNLIGAIKGEITDGYATGAILIIFGLVVGGLLLRDGLRKKNRNKKK